jgi:hypothetical protein
MSSPYDLVGRLAKSETPVGVVRLDAEDELPVDEDFVPDEKPAETLVRTSVP